MSKKQKNEGEGNRTAAKEYNDATTRFTKSGRVGPAAERAKKALDSTEAASLKRAEEAGRRPAQQRRSAPKSR